MTDLQDKPLKPAPTTATEGISILTLMRPDEPVFILRAQDILAPGAILNWIERAQACKNVPLNKTDSALVTLGAFLRWPSECKKWPD